MKQLSFLICVTIVFVQFSCKEKIEKKINPHILISGKVALSEKKSNFTIFKNDIVTDERETFLISVDSSGYFEYSLDLDRPQTIFIGIYSNGNIPFFAFPNDTISFHISDEFTVDYTNKQHEQFNNNLNLINDEIYRIGGSQLTPMKYKTYTEQEVKNKLDSVNLALKSRLVSLKDSGLLNAEFTKYAKLEIDFYLMSSLYDYEFFNKNIFNQKRRIPSEYYWLNDTIVDNYTDFIITGGVATFFNRTQFGYSSSNSRSSINKILNIDSTLTRDILISKEIYSVISNKDFSDAKDLINNFFPFIGRNELKRIVKDKYETSLAVYNNPSLASARIKGLKSNDKTGIIEEISGTYKDKVLYLKFWAPYCGPCMAQLPYIKQLETKVSPDDFLVVNICAPYPQEKWRASIKENNISGVHYLLNDTQYNELKSLLNIQGIPRYVLVNKDGEIVNEDAPIPGDEVLQGVNYDLISIIKSLIDGK